MLKEMYRKAKASDKEKICRFMRDMKRAGLKMRCYNGRNFWKGPAVSCNNLQEVLSCTKVPCQWDNLGLGYIVYPNQSM